MSEPENKQPKCSGCYQRKPRFPEADPRFCTMHCAADWAVAMTEGQRWDAELEDWCVS